MVNKSLQDLSLYLTEQCNLNCSYCYIEKNRELTLSIEEIKKAVDIFYEHCSLLSQPTITILGGEPLMTYPLLLEAIDYINKKFERNIDLILFTNGTLLTPERADELILKKVRIFVSLDGLKKVNDCYRKYFYSPEISTFDTVMRNFKAMSKKTRSEIGVNMVVGPKTAPLLLKNIKFFQKLGLKQIDFSLLSYGFWEEEEIKKLKEELSKFLRFYIGLFTGKSKGNLFKIDILEHLLMAGNSWEQMGNCHRVKFAADKNFYFCDAFFSLPPKERLKYSVGDLKKGIIIKNINSHVVEASVNISKVKHESREWHNKHKRVYCPFSIYFYTKFNKQNLGEYLDSFYRMSDIYTAVFVYLGDILKSNKKFVEFYFGKNGKIPTNYL